MRNGFSQQLSFNITPIEEVVIPLEKRDHLANLMSALQHLYQNKELCEKVEVILYKAIIKTKQATGRTGMNLWQIFVLAQTRLCMNISYDQLLSQANYHGLLRGILGVEPNDYTKGHQYSRQNIVDNVSLLNDELIKQINEVIVEMGHKIFKKKEAEALRLKTDSFVVETETYFPTDYRLLYDSGRKCLEIIGKFHSKYNFQGWRQWKDSRKKLKSLYRTFGKTTSGGGKNKQEREKSACESYLSASRRLSEKVSLFLKEVPLLANNNFSIIALIELEWFKSMLDKHIDLLERRIINKETIPHEEKLFSIFLPFTEWINKGKMNPSVEIGKKLFVTTDQYNLIVDYQLGDKLNDQDAIIPILDRLYAKYSSTIASLSTDKGFSTKANKELINTVHSEIALIMPKKGKRTQTEKEEEKSKSFKELKNAHSAIESNINELEHRGLDRCPDRSVINFNKYVGLAIGAYNLHKIGKELISIQLNKNKQKQEALRQAA